MKGWDGMPRSSFSECWLKAQHSENEDHGIWSHHFMGNRWGNSGNSVRLYFGGLKKITADGVCSHELKRRLLLGRKVMTNLDSIFKSRDITLPTKVHLEKAMAPHSSTLAWKIPWADEPGRLQSMGSLRVRHDWATSLLLFTFIQWRRQWQPTPVFLPGESQGRQSLVGFRLWGHTELDMTEAT